MGCAARCFWVTSATSQSTVSSARVDLERRAQDRCSVGVSVRREGAMALEETVKADAGRREEV